MSLKGTNTMPSRLMGEQGREEYLCLSCMLRRYERMGIKIAAPATRYA